MLLESIVIGDRVRKDMGDLDALAESIMRHGLLHPVVVKKDHTLVAGHRRMEAARRLGWKEIPVTMIEVEDLLSAERDENTVRKDFTPTEAVEIGQLIETQHKLLVKAAQRRAAEITTAKRNGVASGNLPPAIVPGDTRDVVGRAVGMSGSQYDRAKAVVAAAEADPETFGDLPLKMDETRNVSGVHHEMQARKNGKKLRHVALRKLHYQKPNREMQRAVDALEGICIVLKGLPVKQLETGKTKGWATALKKTASIITRVAREVESVQGK